MNVYCDDLRVFAETLEPGDPNRGQGLERLLWAVRRGVHRLIVDEPDALLQSAWFQQYGSPRSARELAELFERADPALDDRALDPLPPRPAPRVELRPGGIRCTVKADREARPIWILGAAALTDWLQHGLQLLVENEDDWALVAGPCRIYQRPTLTQAKDQHKLAVVQCGGSGEVLNRLRGVKATDRIFVLMDSDRLPGSPHIEGSTQLAVREEAKRHPNVYLFILKKREAENYLPAAVWRNSTPATKGMPRGKARDKAGQRLKALRRWERLTPTEKDFADLEHFFPDAKAHLGDLLDRSIVPDIDTLEARAGDELRSLLDALEAWL